MAGARGKCSLTDERRLDGRAVANFHVAGGAVDRVGQVERRHVQHDLLAVSRLDAPLTQLARRPQTVIARRRRPPAVRRPERTLRLLQRPTASWKNINRSWLVR